MIIILSAYINIKTSGPQLAILYVLLKHEIKTKRRFVNADYEEIQNLRRTFFLSRWLMKDYQSQQENKKPPPKSNRIA
jgi:hypothetical protein